MGGETGPEQQYSLRWNDFHTSILSSFRHLRDEEDFVDVTLACDGCSFTAHKVVLSACSPYFRRLLKANPCQHPIVILRDVQQKDMESLLRFMYNGEVHIGQDQLTDFLKTAQMLQVRGLADVPPGAAGQKLTTAPPEKISPTSHSLPWPVSEMHDSLRDGGISPPPLKRSRSSDRPSRDYITDRRRSPSRGNGIAEMRESLLGQALEGGPTIHTNSNNQKGHSDSSLQAQSTGEDSNSSDTALSDRGRTTPKPEPGDYSGMLDDHPLLNSNGGSSIMDQPRTPTFPGALLGLQDSIFAGLPGLMPGPSGLHGSTPDNFGHWSPANTSASAGGLLNHHQSIPWQSRLSMTATTAQTTTTSSSTSNVSDHDDPQKPKCPECGKQYSNNSNLKQHLVNVHTVSNESHPCPVCGKNFKTKQYAQIHMLSMHGIRKRQSMVSFSTFAKRDFSRRSLDMLRVRATDPRPCPKCGKIYRSAHTLRTHLEDKHTVCPGYRCVLCGTVAKSRNSLHSHMSRQHRGISTKDLPVLPMPSPFDPELASRLLAKAGVKVSAAELRARASPTGPRRSDVKLDAKSAYSGAPSEAGSSICGDNDPEDLTMSHSRYGGMDHLAMSPPGMNHFNTTITKITTSKHNTSSQPLTGKNIDSIVHNLSSKDYPSPAPPGPPTSSTGSAILDTYLQFIAENSLGMGMTSEQAAAAVHAAKLAQLNAISQLDKTSQQNFLEKMQQQIANDFSLKRPLDDSIRRNDSHNTSDEIQINDRNRSRDDDPEPIDDPETSADEGEYSEDEPECEEPPPPAPPAPPATVPAPVTTKTDE